MRMIQPVNALTPQARFRGTHGNARSGLSEPHVTMLKAAGISAGAGGLTTLVAKSYTNSFAHASVLGVFGAFLTLFFMTPHLIEQIGLNGGTKRAAVDVVAKQEAPKVKNLVKEYIAPVKKLVQFKSEQA